MRANRFTYALNEGLFALPEAGLILVLGAEGAEDLPPLPPARLAIVTRDAVTFHALKGQGFQVSETATGLSYAAAYIALPRARAEAEALLAEASARLSPGGLIILDGARTDGVERLWRDLKARGEVSPALAKAHGRIFTLAAAAGFEDWAAQDQIIAGGFVTRPGVFSADGPDPGSALLAEALPARLKGKVIDLGAGWGFLAKAVLARPDVTRVLLVEANGTALDCARKNIQDARAEFIWADACAWQAPFRADHVICNPPFHRGRAADPALGLAVITAARRLLAPDGKLWLVANRHLPYQTALQSQFGQVDILAQTNAFRVICAQKPLRPRP